MSSNSSYRGATVECRLLFTDHGEKLKSSDFFPAIVAGKKSLKVGLEWGKIVFLDSSGTDISKRISQIYHY